MIIQVMRLKLFEWQSFFSLIDAAFRQQWMDTFDSAKEVRAWLITTADNISLSGYAFKLLVGIFSLFNEWIYAHIFLQVLSVLTEVLPLMFHHCFLTQTVSWLYIFNFPGQLNLFLLPSFLFLFFTDVVQGFGAFHLQLRHLFIAYSVLYFHENLEVLLLHFILRLLQLLSIVQMLFKLLLDMVWVIFALLEHALLSVWNLI